MTYPSLLERLADGLEPEFRLEREMGGGGMSRVFLAEERDLGRRVVIKVLPPELTTDLSADRFRREVLIAAQLQHPNIVPVLSAGQAGELLYYTMPFVAGESLRVRLAAANREGPPGLPMNDVVRIFRDVARAMGYAHRRGIVHRDLKPDNILLSDDGVLVADFGIAKAMFDAALPGAVVTRTADGRAIGTVGYMSPEQAVGDTSTDHRADIYAAGVLAYEMLTGSMPFAGHAVTEVLAAQAVRDAPRVASRRSSVPPPLAKLVARCLARRPDDRPSTAEDIIRVLDAIVSGEPTSFAERIRGLASRRRFVGVSVVAVLLMALAIFLIRLPEARREKLRFLTMVLGRDPPVLSPHRYLVGTFQNRTGDPRFDQHGYLIASSIEKALAVIPNIEVVSATTRQTSEALVAHFPWLISPDQRSRAAAREVSASMLISGSLFMDGDSLRVSTTMSDLATNALTPSVQDVFAPAAHADTLVARLTSRIVATIGFIADTGVVARAGAYSDAASPAAYESLRRGMEAYFRHDSMMYTHLRQAERLDETWVTPTTFLAYIDAWNQRAGDLERDLARAKRLADRMTPAEQGLVAYGQALARNDLPALLPAAMQFMRNTPGSMESPLLVSSTALGLRLTDTAARALSVTAPDRGLNLVGPYYWQSRIGLAQMRGNLRGVIDAAHEGERRFPRWILFRVYEARALVAQGKLDRLDGVIDAAQLDTFPRSIARAVVAAHAASALAMLGRDADARTIARAQWPAAFKFYDDTAQWVQEAVANLAVIGQRWTDLASMESRGSLSSAHALADRLSYAAVGRLHLGDTASAIRFDSVLAANHPMLDFGYRELARARIAVHRGQYDRAVRLLEQSAAEGVRLQLLWGIDFLSDPFLAPLRDYPPFVHLVAHAKR